MWQRGNTSVAPLSAVNGSMATTAVRNDSGNPGQAIQSWCRVAPVAPAGL